MQVWFIFSLIFSLIVAAFVVLNSEVVTIKFFWVNYELSHGPALDGVDDCHLHAKADP